ncbi:Neutral ceramidase [Phytophthora cinnamomi]|uniref:Neutral ceramidase n=1 Tax=Phytophthora cinnamomi TaxID=4785 RepID=UPI00355A99DC|nr:Neutral ceramidase [Phytophthora cinnamomi]
MMPTLRSIARSSPLTPTPVSGVEDTSLSPLSSSSRTSADSWGACDTLAQRTQSPRVENEEEEEQPCDFGGEFPGDYNCVRDDEDDGDHNNNTVSNASNGKITPDGAAAPLRKRFGPDQDYLLAVQANADMPFKANFGEVRKKWQALASKLNGIPTFRMEPISGKTAQARFETLICKHKAFEAGSSGKTGTDEKHTQFIQVMTDVMKKWNDHKENKAKAAAKAAGAERSKVLAGDVVRAAAVSRLQYGKRAGASDDGESDQSSRPKKQQARATSEWVTAMQEMKSDRTKALDEFIRIQKVEVAQRQKELEFERVERDKRERNDVLSERNVNKSVKSSKN